MDCPVCHEPMVVLEYDQVEIDYCVSCRGIWLDAGELELLFGDEQTCAAYLASGDPKEAGHEAPRRCPICRKKMAKGITAGEDPVTYDRCVRGDGLWFDDGELQLVLQQGAGLDDAGKVGGFLREVFPGAGGQGPGSAVEEPKD